MNVKIFTPYREYEIYFSKITKNHLADPKIGFYVCIRVFLKDKKRLSKVGIDLARRGGTVK